MKKICIILLLLLIMTPVFALDIVQTKKGAVNGKILSYSDGLMIISEKGLDQSYVRVKKQDYFDDYIKYRPNPLSRKVSETRCRVVFVDKYNAIFETPEGRIDIPRYRIKTMILNFN